MPDTIIAALITGALGIIGSIITVLYRKNRKSDHANGKAEREYKKKTNELDFEYYKKYPYKSEVKTNHFEYTWKDQAKNVVELQIRTLLSIKSLKDGDIHITTSLYSQGRIEPSFATSEPGRTNSNIVLEKDGDSNNYKGHIDINLFATEKYDPFMIVLGTKHTVQLGDEQKPPIRSEDPILWQLYSEIINSNHHAFVGTRITSPTDYVRFIIDFEPELVPTHLYAILIDSDLKKIDPKPIVARMDSSVIYEFNSPKIESGLYVWWEWPNAIQNK